MKTLKTAAVLLLTSLSSSAYAGFVSGTHTLSNGKSVDLQNLQWMPLTHSAGLSRTDIADGFTDNFGTRWDASSWRFATRAETSRLLWSLAEDGNGWSTNNQVGATWFRSKFGSYLNGTYSTTFSTEHSYALFGYGATNECPDTKTCYYGAMGVDAWWGWFHHDSGLTISANSNKVFNEYSDTSWAHLLVREDVDNRHNIPAAATVTLVGLGLCIISLRRRQRAKTA